MSKGANLNSYGALDCHANCNYNKTMIAWDETKRQANIKSHGIDLAALECVFDYAMLTKEDDRKIYGEKRLLSLAWFEGRVVFLVWTERNELVRLISCRYGTKHETTIYFKAIGYG